MIKLVLACGSSDDDDDDTDASGGTAGTRADGDAAGSGNASSGGTPADGGTAGEASGGSGNAGGSSGKGGSTSGFAGNGTGGCDNTCSGCTDSELTVHCSFGSREVANDTDDVAELCAAAAIELAGVGGAEGGNTGAGGAASDYCDGYVERGTEILGCDFGCLAKETWTKLGICAISGECCILESYQSCE